MHCVQDEPVEVRAGPPTLVSWGQLWDPVSSSPDLGALPGSDLALLGWDLHLGCWLCGFGELCLRAFVSLTVKGNTTTATCIIRSFYVSGASVTQAPGKHVNARSAGWAFPRLLALKKHGPRNPTPPFRSFWGIRVKMQDLSFLSPLRGLPSLPGGSPISPYGGLPFTFGGLLLPLRSLPLRGVSHLHWGSPVSP